MTNDPDTETSEDSGFKPIPVSPPNNSPILFAIRCLVDVQLATIVRELRPALRNLKGNILDVGAGESPWRDWMPEGVVYRGLDIESAGDFGMSAGVEDVTYYAGEEFPFQDDEFDGVLCVEVLEHAADPEMLLAEIARVLKPSGHLILTVPWSARRHHIPNDFHRFTKERLLTMLSRTGFSDVEVRERGSDIGVIANKLVMREISLLTPKWKLGFCITAPLGIALLPLTALFLLASDISMRFGWGSPEDPLGYFVLARLVN